MSRKPTPPPERCFVGSGGFFAVVFTIPVIGLWLVSGRWWNLFFAIPTVFCVACILQELLLLIAAWRRWDGSPIRGILVLSDSPNWKPYIQQHWLPRLQEKVIVLNWSEHKKWRRSLPVRIFHRFGIGGNDFNFNPSLILFRGLRHPFVYRYFFAFRDAKHGNMDALRKLERHMFAQLDA